MRNKRNIYLDLFRSTIKDYYHNTFSILHSNNTEEKEDILSRINSNETLRNKFKLAYQCKKIGDLGANRLYYNNRINGQDMLLSIAHVIDICNDILTTFLGLRKEYEKWIVTSNYDNAWDTLTRIEEAVGFSIWGISQRLLVAEMKGGIQSNTNVWRFYAENVASNDSLQFLLVNYKDLVDFGLSQTQFQLELDKQLRGSSAEVARYMKSKLKIDRLVNEEDISLILQIDLQFSIIDLFVSFEKILLSKSKSLFQQSNDDQLETILPRNKLPSSVINIIHVLIGEGLIDTDTCLDSYTILDMYSVGDYEGTINACIEYLSETPQDFQMTCIYCKSLLHQQAIHEGTWSSDYSRYVYSIYAMDDDIDASANHLLEATRQYHGIRLGLKIRSFLERKNIIDGKNELCPASFLLDEIANPNIVKQVNTSRIPHLNEYFNKLCSASNAAMVGIVTGNESVIPESKDEIRNLMMHIQCNCVNKEFDFASVNLAKLYSLDIKKNLYIWERVLQITLLFYKEADKYLEAVHLLVDTYFENGRLFRRVLNKNHFKTQYRCKDSKVVRDINHMLLTYLVNPVRYNEQIIVYNNLLDSNGIDDILDCTKIIQEPEQAKWLFFLKSICTVDLLRMDDRLFVKGISPERARYKLLQILDTRYKINDCTDEMFEIRKIESVQDKLQKIQNGRINADTEKIYQVKEEEWEGIFSRYIKVPNDDTTIYYVELPNQGIQFSDDKVKQSHLVVRSSTQKERKQQIMKDLIRSIVREVLYNENYGLETYLSTRIRHGYCKGQLISFLQNIDLVATFDEGKRLILPAFWKKQTNNLETEYEIIRTIIIRFTQKIEAIIDEVLNSWLRIKFSDTDKGMFDYRIMLSDEVLEICMSLMDEHSDLPGLYREIIDAFWEHTDRLLNMIRDRIDSELKNYYIQSIDEIISMIPQSDNYAKTNNLYRELNSRCQRAKSDTNLALHQFKEAFIRANTGYQDFTMEELGECIQKMFQQQIETGKDNWEVKANSSYILKGQYFLPFVDVLGILGNNAINHSGIQAKSKVKVLIDLNFISREDLNEDAMKDCPELKKHENYVYLSVTNNLNNRINEKSVEGKLKKVFDLITQNGSKEKLLQKEGGSGLIKLCNIIESQINWLYYTEYSVVNHNVTISCIICADTLTKGVKS